MKNYKSQIIKQNLFCISIVLCLFLMVGCETVKEYTKGLVGISTKALEEGRGQAISNTYKLDYESCYAKVRADLLERESYIYAENKSEGMIAIYLSGQDTTPVGIFFKKIDSSNTQVEVSSPSSYAKEFIADYIYEKFNPKEEDKELAREEEKGQQDAESITNEEEGGKEEEQGNQ